MEYDLKLWQKLLITWLIAGPLTVLHMMKPIMIGLVVISSGGIPWLIPAGLGVVLSVYDASVSWNRRITQRKGEANVGNH